MDDDENDENKEKSNNKQAKKITKKIIATIMPTLISILIVLVIASAVYVVITNVVDTIKNLGQSIVNLFLGDENGIEITDEQLDNIISTVESLGVDFDDLGLLGDIDYSKEDVQEQMQEEKRKYTRMFLEAQIVTQELNKRKQRLTRSGIPLSC